MLGTGTRSYNRSPEARGNKRAQKAATAKFLEARERGEVKPVIVSLLCRCSSWEFPHEIEQHKQLGEDHKWPTPEERKRMAAGREFWERGI